MLQATSALTSVSARLPARPRHGARCRCAVAHVMGVTGIGALFSRRIFERVARQRLPRVEALGDVVLEP
jgi:hypothetical protein